MFALQLLKAYQVTLAEWEKAIAELLQKVDSLSSERKQADDTLATFRIEPDRESTVRGG